MASPQTFNYGLRKMLFAPWLAPNSYGTVHTVLGAQNMNLQVVYEQAEARGDDALLDTFAKQISVTVTAQQATVDLTLFSILMGSTLVFNSQYYDAVADQELPQYVALAARIVETNGAGDLHVFVPKLKISNNPTFNATQDAYVFPQFEMRGVREGDVNGMYRFRRFSAPTALAIPLRTAVGGF